MQRAQYKENEDRIIIMGHRGAAAVAPENTLLSVAKAIEIGVDAVEIDVRLTKDRELVVIHDASVDRTTNGRGPVSQYELRDIKTLDAGRGERIPTLQEVVDLVGGQVTLVVELKEEETEKKVVELIRKNHFEQQVYVISFWHGLVKTVKALAPRIKTGVLLVGCPVDACVATQASADAVVMRYGFVNRDFVETAHKEGLQVLIWNIDDRNLLKPYVEMGVDGIASNDPQVLVEYFKRH